MLHLVILYKAMALITLGRKQIDRLTACATEKTSQCSSKSKNIFQYLKQTDFVWNTQKPDH